MDNSKDKNSFKPSGGLKFMVILLFFILGLLFSLPPTMILVYAELPSDYIISFFIASTIPTSFQFVFAPFIEKYTSISYGKKKTWVMATLAVNFVLIFTGSFFTSQNQQVTLGVLFTIVMVFHAIYSLSINALAVKELRIPDKTALMQGVGQISGFFSGSMGLQKLTSKEFAEFIGLSHPITTPAIFFRIVCAIMIFTAISLHFRFKERVLESEKTVQNISILKVLSYYK